MHGMAEPAVSPVSGTRQMELRTTTVGSLQTDQAVRSRIYVLDLTLKLVVKLISVAHLNLRLFIFFNKHTLTTIIIVTCSFDSLVSYVQ